VKVIEVADKGRVRVSAKALIEPPLVTEKKEEASEAKND
jgi:polyribonucleotide nucleotidyltransferase